MIPAVDDTIRQLLARRVPLLAAGGAVTDDQIGFGPPDADWRTHVKGLGTKRALDVCLVDLRDNRRLRGGERTRALNGSGHVITRPAPERLDCHYLITAWSNAALDQGRMADEHRLLHEVVTALVAAQPFVPSEIFAPGSLPGGFPPAIADAELPTVVAPEEGFPKLPEFWQTMGDRVAWRPAVWLIVTVPVLKPLRDAGPMVTATITAYEPGGDSRVNAGGQVRDGAGEPVPGAWVRLERRPSGALVGALSTDATGRFVFTGLSTGSYRLRAGATGAGLADRDVEIPSTTGEHDLRLA